MASIVDASSTLEVMKSANDDFVELILKLKALLNGMEPVTFNMGKYTITVNTVLDLITNYKNGKFEEILLGGQTSSGKQVKLSVDSAGNLCVTDSKGNAVSVSCSKLISSTIEKCFAKVLTAESATIRSIEGKTSIKGGNVSFDSMNFAELEVGTLKAKNVRTETLNVNGTLTCDNLLSLGVRKFAPKAVRNVFYRNNVAIDDAASLLVKNGSDWNMNAGSGCLTPADLGFSQADTPSELQAAMSVPDVIVLQGNTKFTDFKSSIFGIKSINAYTPANTRCYVAPPNSSNFVPVSFNQMAYQFAALMAFPTGAYTPNSSESADGIWWLTSFASSDIGKEVYYQTKDREWKIYRTMTLEYTNGSDTPTVTFGGLTTIPAYSCVRYIVNCIDKTETSGSTTTRKVTYALEFA